MHLTKNQSDTGVQVSEERWNANSLTGVNYPAVTSNWLSGEMLVPTVAICSLLLSCTLISARKWYWNDELFSYYMLSDPSLAHLARAFHDSMANTPPLYFLFGWIWAHGLGASELSLRLFSSLGICAAYLMTWVTLRRVYAFWPTALGTLSVFCLSNVILYQNAEARMYGMFLAVSAACVFLTCGLTRQRDPRALVLVINTIAHGAMVLTHLFGLLYSGALLAALLICDRLAGVFRLRVYLSVAIGWLVFLPYLPSFVSQAAIAYPRGWLLPPNGLDLVNIFVLSPSRAVRGFVLFVLAAAALQRIGKGGRGQKNQQTLVRQREVSTLLVAFAMLVLPIVVWVISRLAKPVFIDRYMIPSSIGSAFVLAHVFAMLLGDCPVRKGAPLYSIGDRRSIGLWVLVGLLLVYPIHVARSLPPEGQPGARDEGYGYTDLPIVTPFSHDFMKRFFYSGEGQRYYFVLDGPSALDPGSGSFGPGEFKNMEALRRNYSDPFASHVVASENFLEEHRRFLVLTVDDYAKVCTAMDLHCPRWLQTRILANSIYRIQPIGRGEGRTMLLVEAAGANTQVTRLRGRAPRT